MTRGKRKREEEDDPIDDLLQKHSDLIYSDVEASLRSILCKIQECDALPRVLLQHQVERVLDNRTEVQGCVLFNSNDAATDRI